MRIQQASDIASTEIAKLIIQAIFAIGIRSAKQGSRVTLNLKLGKLTLSNGSISFASEQLRPVGATRAYSKAGGDSQMNIVEDAEVASVNRVASPA